MGIKYNIINLCTSLKKNMEIQFSRKAEETHNATYEHNKSFIV